MEILDFTTIPANSFLILPEADRTAYIQAIIPLHIKIRDVLYSTDTGAFVRGIAKTYDVSPETAPKIAFAILEIAIGKKTIAQLPSILSTELQLPIDTAQKMATEIEHDVLAPIKTELSDQSSQQKGSSVPSRTTAQAASSGMKNVLNLKEIAAKPPQTQLPPKPIQPSLPPRRPVPPKMPPSPIEPIRFT